MSPSRLRAMDRESGTSPSVWCGVNTRVMQRLVPFGSYLVVWTDRGTLDCVTPDKDLRPYEKLAP